MVKARFQNRRGVTLMFVVSMLVLFLLMATSFVVLSTNFNRTSRSRGKVHQFSNQLNATDLIERAFYDLIRGPSLSNTTSPLRAGSLLEDMYGYGFSVTAKVAALDTSEHFLLIEFSDDARRTIDDEPYTPTPVPGLFGGLILTVTNGGSKDFTGRIIDHVVEGTADTEYTHRVVVIPTGKETKLSTQLVSAIAGSRLVVNGRAFGGSGAGHFSPVTTFDVAKFADESKQPNFIGLSKEDLLGKNGKPGYLSLAQISGGIGPNSLAPNESYDALDHQNIFLGSINADGTPRAVSFHRGENRELRGSLAAFIDKDFDPETEPLTQDRTVEVDNNNDGVAEGAWLDIGLPDQCRQDGTCVRPLISFTVIDLDGRNNVNAHGSLLRAGDDEMDALPFVDGPPAETLPRGQGYGPPEIRMQQALGGPDIERSVIEARYRSDDLSDIAPGEPEVRDGWSKYKLFGYPEVSFGESIPGTVSGHFGSAMDMHGRFAYGYPAIYDLEYPEFPVGMPIASVADSQLTNEAVDSPYEMSFFDGHLQQRSDSPFTAAELEYVLRPNDIDYRFLKRRLFEVGELDSDSKNLVTTHSFEVPTVFGNPVTQVYRLLDTANDGTSLLGIPNDTEDREDVIRMQMRQLLPPEIFRGLPMNVNREFGDGIDNNGNGIIDEVGETDQLEHPGGETIGFDHDNDAEIGDIDSGLARVTFAKHLYILMLLATEQVDRDGDAQITVNDWYDFNDDGFTDVNDLIDYRKIVAQWCINVVDFRDPDSIMTAFEVDLNPWNGWDVDSDLSTEESLEEGDDNRNMRTVVWGMERPELLITETMATHDRRTQDTDSESVGPNDQPDFTDGDDPDSDFDSQLVPKASVFFELYNPWVMTDANQIRPAEVYDASLSGVDLQKTTPFGGAPVWRMVVTETDQEELDPDDASNNESEEKAIFTRRIYFTRPPASVDLGPEVFYPANDIVVGSVSPGRYAVIGSAGVKVGNRYDTYFGRRKGDAAVEATELQSRTRRISLSPTTSSLEFVWFDEDAADADSAMKTHVRDGSTPDGSKLGIINIPIGENSDSGTRDLGVSDPISGYSGLTGQAGEAIELNSIADGFSFVSPGTNQPYTFDQPVDQMIDRDHYDEYLKDDGLKPGYRTVHLQRLANPMFPFNAQTNPYRTVDSSAIDLFVFNGVEEKPDPNNVPLEAMRFGSYERRSDLDSPEGQNETEGGYQRALFRSGLYGFQNAKEDNNPTLDDGHIFSLNLYSENGNGANDGERESFGRLNEAYREDFNGNAYPEDEQYPFAWLTWNNRPYVSHFELANVPYTSSYWLSRRFTLADDSFDVYQPPVETDADSQRVSYGSEFGHLFNFHSGSLAAGNMGLSLHRLFDLVEVPSRFIGTETFVNPGVFVNDRHTLSYGMV
ncbi:MAG: hypothetical protein AAF939_06960, partial [Planctomycetota bacterium]